VGQDPELQWRVEQHGLAVDPGLDGGLGFDGEGRGGPRGPGSEAVDVARGVRCYEGGDVGGAADLGRGDAECSGVEPALVPNPASVVSA
jgi:hypothetical protein